MDKILLLVEPNRRLAGVLEKWLKEKCYSVTVAINLEQAFSRIRANPAMYYMCILDADFPGGVTEGLDVCQKLKSSESTKGHLMKNRYLSLNQECYYPNHTFSLVFLLIAFWFLQAVIN